MNIKRVLHPEMIMGRRGNPDTIRFYKSVLSRIHRLPENDQIVDGVKVAYGWSFPEELAYLEKDPRGREHILILKKFKEEIRKTYYIGKDFTKALASVDRDIPTDLLPQKFFAYIAFAEGTVFDETSEVEGAYVYVGDLHEAHMAMHGCKPGYRSMWIGYMCKDGAVGVYTFDPIAERVMETMNKLSIEEAVQDRVLVGEEIKIVKPADNAIHKREVVFRTLINAVLYINSLEPDLKMLRPEKEMSLKKARKLKDSVSDCSLPLVLVNWNYKQPMNYSVDSTWVHTHLRIQRCGPGLSQCKFVWVREHERHYNKETNNDCSNNLPIIDSNKCGASNLDASQIGIPCMGKTVEGNKACMN